MRAWWIVVLGVLPVGCAGPEDDLIQGNQEPAAALRAPVIAPLGVEVALDASASLDPDNDPLTYVFQFNDGSEAIHTPEPEVLHTFMREAVYTVLVRVVDIHNAESLAAQDVSVRSEYPDVPDFCDEDELRPCFVGDECEEGVCYSNGGGLD